MIISILIGLTVLGTLYDFYKIGFQHYQLRKIEYNKMISKENIQNLSTKDILSESESAILNIQEESKIQTIVQKNFLNLIKDFLKTSQKY